MYDKYLADVHHGPNDDFVIHTTKQHLNARAMSRDEFGGMLSSMSIPMRGQ